MTESLHRAEQHRSAIPRVEAFALTSNRSFPRHAHDQFGIGVLHAGAHGPGVASATSKSGAGDIITVNPGEMHDAGPVQGGARSWRMLYLDPDNVTLALAEDLRGDAEITLPVLRDPLLADRFVQLFASLTVPDPDALGAEEHLMRVLAHLLARCGSRPLHNDNRTPADAFFAPKLVHATQSDADTLLSSLQRKVPKMLLPFRPTLSSACLHEEPLSARQWLC
ncbi:AraC family ligand binding domain-containing protein [Roseomonas sp. KE2513]|uniref:AraC family ligand binding domain-containing protein n=1 Tax=Roseomonas sp. KE2513 TaxID=2479202 RepID=UPI0018DFC1D4|nr:AraC family ligand binding domain-containing protein [Roseomonas sp. KE2513]